MDGILKRWDELARTNQAAEVAQIILSGFAQTAINYNPICGAFIMLAVFVASPIQGLSGLLASGIACIMIYALGMSRGLAREGLYTINPVLIGLAVPMVTNSNNPEALPQILMLSVVGSILCVLVTSAMRRVLSPIDVTPLVIPYSLVLILMAGLTYYATALGSTPLFTPGVAELLTDSGDSWTFEQFATAVLNGLAQVAWLEDVPLAPVAGVILMVGVLCASRVDFVIGVLCATCATGLAIALGVGHGGIALGLYGYNAALCGWVIFGRTYKMSAKSFVLAFVLAMLTVPFALGLKPLMAAIGAPVAAFPFATLGICAMLASKDLAALEYNPPKMWSVPEKSGR